MYRLLFSYCHQLVRQRYMKSYNHVRKSYTTTLLKHLKRHSARINLTKCLSILTKARSGVYQLELMYIYLIVVIIILVVMLVDYDKSLIHIGEVDSEFIRQLT